MDGDGGDLPAHGGPPLRALSIAYPPAWALRMIFCEAGRRASNSASVIRPSRLSGVTTDTPEHSTADEVIARPWIALVLIYDLLGPRNLAATVRTGPLGGESLDPDGSMADIAAVEADASLVAAMKPLLARF